MQVWGYELSLSCLTEAELSYIKGLPRDLPSLEWVWSEMDRIWQLCQLSDRLQTFEQFYRHPVWIMNGIFTSVDPVSVRHRQAIAQHLVSSGATKIADLGGGFGELAVRINSLDPDVDIDIIEPFASRVTLHRISSVDKIRKHDFLEVNTYDAIVAQDVLEHVEDPIKLAYQMTKSVKPGGILLFANCFYPVIKCHLRSTFHLRHTFKFIMRIMGLKYRGNIAGAEHAQFFILSGVPKLKLARLAEKISRLAGPLLNAIGLMASKCRFGFKKEMP